MKEDNFPRPRTIGIVGGTGRMGQWFKNFFEKQGYQVLISGRHTQLGHKELAKQSDVVIVSVPIRITTQVIKEVGPYIKPGSLFMDFTSVKVAPVKAMLESTPDEVEVIGAHPLFGPSVKGLKGQIIVLCPARSQRWLGWVQEVFKEAKLPILTPQEHDKSMAVLQALPHFILLVLGLTLKSLPIDLHKLSTPTFNALKERLKLIAQQNPSIYADIQNNEFYLENILPHFLQILDETKQTVLSRDIEKIEALFQRLVNEWS